ncbi:MAG TPA: hypothetical protein VJ731_08905 [Terriglobales bacterium]|nr:hypothetical protein [Terriglobales bacterium]
MRSDLERRDAHTLLDMLPDEKVSAVKNLLQVMVEPLSDSLSSVSTEEEQLTPEAQALLERSRASLARGKGVSHENIRQEFGKK